MIFAVEGHIEKIKKGTKTETRRGAAALSHYHIGHSYSVQPKRAMPGIKEGRILITDKWLEQKIQPIKNYPIPPQNAIAEGNYTTEEYEILFNKLHPDWVVRSAFKFKFLPAPPMKNLRDIFV